MPLAFLTIPDDMRAEEYRKEAAGTKRRRGVKITLSSIVCSVHLK
jgi:hypothetical protein